MTQAGKAYAFFDCSKPKSEVLEEIGLVRRVGELRIPSELELSLTEGFDDLKGDEKLMAIAQKAKEVELGCLLEGTYPKKSNRQTAEELAVIMNQVSQSPLYNSSRDFRGEIVYEDDGRYIFVD